MNKSINLLEERLEASKKALSYFQGALSRPRLTFNMKDFLSKQVSGLKELISDYTEAVSLLKGENAERQTKPTTEKN